jgi:hypothetical protein
VGRFTAGSMRHKSHAIATSRDGPPRAAARSSSPRWTPLAAVLSSGGGAHTVLQFQGRTMDRHTGAAGSRVGRPSVVPPALPSAWLITIAARPVVHLSILRSERFTRRSAEAFSAVTGDR